VTFAARWSRLRLVASESAPFADDRSAEMGRATGRLLYQRLSFLPIVFALTLWQLLATHASPLRLTTLAIFFAAVGVHLAVLFRRHRRGKETRTLGLAGSLTAIILASLTGGLDSPFLLVLPVTATVTTAGGPRLDVFLSYVVQLSGLGLLWLVGGSQPLLSVIIVAGALCIALYVGLVLRATFDRILLRIGAAHEDLLRLHSEQLRALTTLSAEIARELRGPLQHVAELSRTAADELRIARAPAGQLEEVRLETARLQQILEEFLNFSRPLSPLSLASIEGRRIGSEVVDLFQGIAHERRLSLLLRADPVVLRCDPRKIRQVLINLVQNAVDASAPGGEIDIEVRSQPDAAAIFVLDRGTGVAPEIEPRLFQPGVTNKPLAPGLGLTIARSIAEQHGGRLILRGRDGGGCAAELMLPVSPGGPTLRGRAA
jgi:signal transduction histidine kinase